MILVLSLNAILVLPTFGVAIPGLPGAPRERACSSARHFHIGGQQQARQTLRPFSLSRGLGDQILTDLDLDMRQATPFAMHRDGIIGRVGDAIRLVIAHNETFFGAQQFK